MCEIKVKPIKCNKWKKNIVKENKNNKCIDRFVATQHFISHIYYCGILKEFF